MSKFCTALLEFEVFFSLFRQLLIDAVQLLTVPSGNLLDSLACCSVPGWSTNMRPALLMDDFRSFPEIGHDRFLPHTFLLTIHNHRQRYLNISVDVAL
jgi:hypothetical protein